MLLRSKKVVADSLPVQIYNQWTSALKDSKCAKVTKATYGALVEFTTIPVRGSATLLQDHLAPNEIAPLAYAVYLRYQYRHHHLQVTFCGENNALTVKSDRDSYEETFAWNGERETDAHIQASLRNHCPSMEMDCAHPYDDDDES